MTAKSMKIPPTPTTSTITMITVSLSLSFTTHTKTETTSMQRAKISRFEKFQAQRSEEKQIMEKRAREVKTLCEVEEDPREGIKRRKSLHELMFACFR